MSTTKYSWLVTFVIKICLQLSKYRIKLQRQIKHFLKVCESSQYVYTARKVIKLSILST